MKIQAYISCRGHCEEGLEFYKKSIGAAVTELTRWKDRPDVTMKAPPGFDEKFMNASFRVGDTLLMADDSPGQAPAEFKGVTFEIEVADDAEAQRVFTVLVEAGKVTMALMKTFWTSSFGMPNDKFGAPRMVTVAAPKA